MNSYLNSTNSQLEFITAILYLFHIKIKINIYHLGYLAEGEGVTQGCHLMKSKKRKVHQKMRKKAEARTEKAKKNGNVRFGRLFEFCIVL